MLRHAATRMARVVCSSLLAFGVVLTCPPSAAYAQSVSGTILGTVTDPSGAVISEAKITVTNEGTGLTRSVTSDRNGEYVIPSIPTGRYTVIAELTGFKVLALSNIEVGVDQRARIDLKLEVGAMTESVTIEATSPLVQTSSSELGTTVGNEQIEALPLNGRNFVNLTRTVPGVLRGIPGANIDGAGSLAWRASSSFSANGQRPRDNNFMLDGVDNNETWLQTVVIFPSVDALDEFKLQTPRTLRNTADPLAASSTSRSSRVRTCCAAARSSFTATTPSMRTTSSTIAPGAKSPTSNRTSSAAPWAGPCSGTEPSSSARTRGTGSRRGRRSSRPFRRWPCGRGIFRSSPGPSTIR
jgi:hypothetical protein